VTGYIAPATKVLRYPGVLAAMQRGERVWPLHVELDLAGVCNAACAHCRFGDRQDGAVMDAETARQVIDTLVGGGTLAVTFSGGGEPSCNVHLPELAAYARHEGLSVGIYTNGLHTERLTRCGGVASWVYVSLDADNAHDYKRIKGVDGFAAACETVRQLAAVGVPLPDGPMGVHEGNRRAFAALVNGRRYACTVGVGMLLTGDNWQRAEAMQALGESLGAAYVQFRPIAGLASYAWVPDALRELARIGAAHSPERFGDLYDAWRGVYARGYSVCRASDLAPCIGSDGRVWPCPNLRGVEARVLGSIHDDELAEILARRDTVHVGEDCEVTCRNHALNRTLALVCERQAHEAFV
jgi:MoaA/NifB/PqqE/SkfB family radical SAM enzyme